MIKQKQQNPMNDSQSDAGEKNSSGSVIRAADPERHEERDQRIGEEPDTKRLRSERESVEEAKKSSS